MNYISSFQIKKETLMKPGKDEVLKGNALFVLQNTLPLSIAGITYVWGMYNNENFDDALRVSDSYQYFTGMCGPYWKTPKKEEDLLKKIMIKEGLVETTEVLIGGKNRKTLKITSEGSRYLQGLIKHGMKFKGKTELKSLRLRMLEYRKGK